MNNLNKKLYLSILILFSALIYYIVSVAFPVLENSPFEYFRLILIVISVDGVLISIFIKYIWKWHFLYDWLVPFPNLNGTWEGKIKSTWKDKKTNKELDFILAKLVIKQSFLSISCLVTTSKLESYSFISGFIINKEQQILKLVYSYDSTTKQAEKGGNNKHSGTIILNIKNHGKKLEGYYWTDRKTTGDVEFDNSKYLAKLK